MDKISQLLAEAKPLYLKKQKEKRVITGSVFSLVLLLAVFSGTSDQTTTFDEDKLDSYFTALYINEADPLDDINDNTNWLETYGLYEVS